MGGKSSSKSSSSTTTIQSDERIAATDNANVRAFKIDGSNNVLTDLDAIEKAGTAVLAALDAQTQIAMQALGQNKDAINTLGQGTETLLAYKADADKEKDERLTTKLAPYLLAGVSILALTGNLKLKG